MGNIINTVKRFSNNSAVDIPFRRCYKVPIGISRLNKCTCIGNDSSTKGSTDGCEGFQKEVGNDGMHLTTSITSGRGCSHDINFFTLSTAHTEQSGSDEANKNRETQKETINTGCRELGFDEYFEKAGLIYSQTADDMLDSLEDENTKTPTGLMTSNDFLNKVSSEGNYAKNPQLTDELENSTSIDTHESKQLRMHRVSRVDSLSGRNVCEELVDGVPSSGYKISSEVLSEGQIHERTQHKLLSDGIVPIEATTACTLYVRGIKSTPKTSLKSQAIRKRTTTKASNQMLVPKERIRISAPKASLMGQARSATKASNQILVPKENIGISVPSDVVCVEIEKEPTSPLVEQSSGDKVLQANHMSRKIESPLSYVHQSPLTRAKAKSLSISTPDSMKRSRSGRLIVPRLDPGSQNIIYGPDGIIGITNLELHCSQGSNLEPASKRRKRSRRLSPDQNRMLTF